MPVSSYPRVTVQGSGLPNNPQSGQSLMIYNSITGKYEAATASTFSGGAGGATAANQVTQINEAVQSNNYLQAIDGSNSNIALNTVNIVANGVTTNAKLDTLNTDKALASKQDIQSAYLSNIQNNTSTSSNGFTPAELLESSAGYSAANLLVKIQKFSQWNTFTTKVFSCNTQTTFRLDIIIGGITIYPSKILFHEKSEIYRIYDTTSTDKIAQYLQTNGYSWPNVQAGSEIISNGTSATDLFSLIELSTGIFTCYYNVSPYVNP